MSEPKISVIMGIYNCESTLDESIESILSQTYKNWKMIMCDDCSTDGTYKVAQKYVEMYPDKFILIKNEKNMGLNYTLNHCLEYATGDYIARMDGDDISLPKRFETELNFLINHPEYSIVSCQMEYFDENGIYGKSNMKLHPDKTDFVYGTLFCHAPCMVKKQAYDEVGGYTVSDKLLRVEDYHLWVKMYKFGHKGSNLPDVFYRMRNDRVAVIRRKFKFRINESRVIYKAVTELNLPLKNYIYVLKPLIIGILPQVLYIYLQKRKLKGNKYDS